MAESVMLSSAVTAPSVQPKGVRTCASLPCTAMGALLNHELLAHQAPPLGVAPGTSTACSSTALGAVGDSSICAVP